MSIALEDLTPEQLNQLGVKLPRRHTFTKDEARSWSLKVLAVMSSLTQEQRRRVLEHAGKVNRL